VLFVNKQTRQSLIKKIIQTTVIHSQNELLRELKKREINVAQATISRDLWELKVVTTSRIACINCSFFRSSKEVNCSKIVNRISPDSSNALTTFNSHKSREIVACATFISRFFNLEERKKEQLIQAIREVVTKVERVAFLLVVHTLPFGHYLTNCLYQLFFFSFF
jgi:transcriptional regulator of arginine metabolism